MRGIAEPGCRQMRMRKPVPAAGSRRVIRAQENSVMDSYSRDDGKCADLRAGAGVMGGNFANRRFYRGMQGVLRTDTVRWVCRK